MDLGSDGYKILHLERQERTDALSCLHRDRVDYERLKEFIDGPLLQRLEPLGFVRPQYIKFRMSNNNNSNDAALTHSDVYNFTDGPMPCFTLVCYLDKAELEVYPGSHTNPRPPLSALRPQVLHFEPGDMILFPASLLHRGVHYSRGKNRRVLQVFEIFPTPGIYRAEVARHLTVDYSHGKSRQKSLLYYIAQHKSLVDAVNSVMVGLVYHNVQFVVAGNDLPPWRKHGLYVTYEPGGRIPLREAVTRGTWNINVITSQTPTTQDSPFYATCYAALVVVGLVYMNRPTRKKLN